ncbi:MAG: LytR/AlgR family response regulator transcription factor [Flavobacteriales bacterium]
MPLRTIIIDDERLARKELRELLEAESGIESCGEASNAEEAIDLIRKEDPDLLLLDIQMPGKDGFQMLQELEKAPRVIFVTAYDDHALKAFEVNALDYLLKPVDQQRFQEAVDRVKKEATYDAENREERGANDVLGIDDRIFIKDGEKCWFIPLKEVRVFESDENYIRVRFQDQDPLILRSLNELEKRLDERHFFRTGRKRIVNLNHVEDIEPWFNGRLLIKIRGEEEDIEVSRRQAARFKERMSL